MAKRESDADRPRYVLYFRGHRPPDQHSRIWVPIYWDPAYAHGVILRFLGNAEFTRDGNVLTITDTPFTLTCEQLEDVLRTEPGVVRDEDARTALRFKLGSWEEDHSKVEDEVETVGDDGEVKTVKIKAPKPERPKKAAKPDSFVTIGEWAAKWGITPMEARSMLRASDLEKPPYGWAFDPKDEKKIKKICGVK